MVPGTKDATEDLPHKDKGFLMVTQIEPSTPGLSGTVYILIPIIRQHLLRVELYTSICRNIWIIK